jgi:hypothetical protein
MSLEAPVSEGLSDEYPRELIDLGAQIQELPPQYKAKLGATYDQVMDCVRRRRRILNLVQEALSQLRLDIKYLMFDLEATRKERDTLRSKLNNNDE